MYNSIREEIQTEAENAIKSADFKGIVDVSPRVGKSKILIDSIRNKKDWNITICSPYKAIQDSWEAEFENWGLTFEVGNICSRSLDKIESELDLLVVDEIQTLSDRQIATIIAKKPKRILGLTGTLSLETKINLAQTLSIRPIFQYSVEDAIRDGIIANFEIVVVRCNFDNNLANIPSGTKKKPVMRTELGHIGWLDREYEKYKMLSFRDASFSFLKDTYVNKRRMFIYGAESKLKVAKRIIDRLNRCLIYTGSIEKAEYLCTYSFHSKNKKENNLERFIDGTIDKCSVINMVSMGITIPNLKYAVVHQLQSNSEMSVQKILRACNLEDDKTARIYITVYKDSQDEKWVTSALSSVESSRITIIDESQI